MKKIIFFLLFFFLFFVLIGLFFTEKEKKISKKKNEQKITKSEVNTEENIISPLLKELSQDSFLGTSIEFQKKVNEEISQLTEKLTPDNEKSISTYTEEIKKLQQKFKLPETQKELPPQFFLDLAKELSLIRPPSLLYSFHLELTKIYYTIGLALQEAEKTTDLNKKILLYNFVRSNLEKIKF